MANRSRPVRLAAGEMELMSMLWAEGPITLAAAHRAFGRYGQPVGYPTMQTRLNRLVDKGLAARTAQRPAEYQANVSPESVARGHLDQLLDNFVGSSVAPLVSHLIAERPLSPDEIKELKRLLEDAQGLPSKRRRSELGES